MGRKAHLRAPVTACSQYLLLCRCCLPSIMGPTDMRRLGRPRTIVFHFLSSLLAYQPSENNGTHACCSVTWRVRSGDPWGILFTFLCQRRQTRKTVGTLLSGWRRFPAPIPSDGSIRDSGGADSFCGSSMPFQLHVVPS